MYCKRCDKEVGGFHKCFFGKNSIIPIKQKPNPKKRISYKLLQKLKTNPELKISDQGFIERHRPSTYQRGAGAWSWSVENNGIVEIGSSFSMRECLYAKKILIFCSRFGTFEIIPE